MTAGETLGNLFPINVSFVQGEQPASGKFSGWANQTSAALTTVGKGIGDLWGEEFENNKLYVSTRRPPHIMNLARFIGPASALNPLRPVAPGTRVEHDVVLDPDDIPIGTNEFNLRTNCDCEPPIDWSAAFPQGSILVHTSIETVLEYISTTKGDSAFVQHVASRTLLAASGDYHVDTNGNVFTYNPTDNYASVSPGANTTYQTAMVPDMYDQATLNVIPDMNQETSDGLCDVLSNSEDSAIPVGEYVIRTPYIVKLSVRDANDNPLTPGDSGCPPASFSTTERARLPYALKAADGMNLSDGDQIPDGFFGLWEEGVGMVSGLTFELCDVTAATDSDGFDSDYCVIVTGGTLTTNAVYPTKGSTYRLITVGTTLTESVARINRRLDTHSHSTRHSGFPVPHASLVGNHISADVVLADWGTTVSSPQSQVTGNHHPQYLCRYGWTATHYTKDSAQQDNAMLGGLFMAAAKSSYLATDDYADDTVDSHSIYFGNIDVQLFRDVSVETESGINALSSWTAFCAGSGSSTVANLLMGNQSPGDPGEKTGLEWKSANTDAEFAFFQTGSVATAGVQAGIFYAHGQPDSKTGMSSYDHARMMTDAFVLNNSTSGKVISLTLSPTKAELTSTDEINIVSSENIDLIHGVTGGHVKVSETGSSSYITLDGDAGTDDPRIYLYANTNWSYLLLETDDLKIVGDSGVHCTFSFDYVDMSVCGHIIVPKGTSNPTTGVVEGSVYYNTTANELRAYNGSTWDACN